MQKNCATLQTCIIQQIPDDMVFKNVYLPAPDCIVSGPRARIYNRTICSDYADGIGRATALCLGAVA